MIVVDASAAIELALMSRVGRAVMQRVDGRSLHAPELLLVEVAQVLRRLTAGGDVSARRAEQALEDLLDLDVALYEHEALVRRAWQLRSNLTAYDAVYVALAEELDAPLLTTDARLASAAGNRARVELATG